MVQTKVDELTAIGNRRAFKEHLTIQWKLAIRNESELAILMIDVDHFKSYNDFYGHQEGDKTLQQIGRELQLLARRPTDLVARFGDEEFIIILPNTSIDDAENIANKIRRAIEDLKISHASSTISKFLTISTGCASIIPKFEDSSEGLVTAADLALYFTKRNGRNRVSIPGG